MSFNIINLLHQPKVSRKDLSMQISRCLLATGAVVALFPLTLRADTEAQNKAREALQQKLNELEVQPAKAAPKAAPVAKPAPTKPDPPAAPAQPAPQATATESGFAPQVQSTAPTADSDAIAKAREAMRQKVQELQPDVTSPSAAAPAAAASSAAATAPVVAAPLSSSGDSRFSEVPNLPSANPDAVAKARDAMRQTDVAAPPVVNAAGKPAPIVVNQPAPWTVSAPPPPAPKPTGKESKFPPIPAPDLPITADKNQKLADLLQKYNSDQITPEEYHSERAKILAGK